MNIYDNFFDNNKELILIFILSLIVVYIFTNTYINNQTIKEGFIKGLPKIRLPKIRFPRIPSPEELFKKALKKIVRPAVYGMQKGILRAVDEVKSTAYRVQDGANKVASKANGIKNKTVGVFNSITNDMKNFAVRVSNFLANLGKYFADAMQTIVKAIVVIGKQSVNILKSILISVKNMFVSLGNGLVTGIIKPFLSVFLGIKNIFAGIFGVLITVVKKIFSIVDCYPIYMFNGMKKMFLYFYNAITPGFVKIFISLVINYIIYPIMYVSYYVFLYVPLLIIEFFTGVNFEKDIVNSTSKCMKFDIKKPVQQMEDGSKQLIPQFKPFNVDFKFNLSKQSRKINSTLKDAVKKLNPGRIKF